MKENITNNYPYLLDDIYKIRGERLKDCLRGMHYNIFADMVTDFLSEDTRRIEIYSANRLQTISAEYVGMLINGKRHIDWNKANLFADVLNYNSNYPYNDINPNYIMGYESTMRKSISHNSTLDLDTFGTQDRLFIEFLIAAGHEIVFHVIKLDDGKQPVTKEIFNRTVYFWDKIEINTSINNLQDFCLSDAHCKLKEQYIDDAIISSVIIRSVSVDNYKMPFGLFVFTVNRLVDYMDYTFSSLRDFKNDYNMQQGMDNASEDELLHTRKLKAGVLPNGLTPEENMIRMPHETVEIDGKMVDAIVLLDDKDIEKFLGKDKR